MIEIVTFRLREGVDPDAFRTFDERLQTEFFYQQPGLERRTTARSADGTYACITHWGSEADAEAAAAKSTARNAFTGPLSALIDPSMLQLRRYDTL
jgi:heme-degrading monooxygenase HmoA